MRRQYPIRSSNSPAGAQPVAPPSVQGYGSTATIVRAEHPAPTAVEANSAERVRPARKLESRKHGSVREDGRAVEMRGLGGPDLDRH